MYVHKFRRVHAHFSRMSYLFRCADIIYVFWPHQPHDPTPSDNVRLDFFYKVW